MKRNLRLETEFPISTFLLSIRITPQIVELKEKVLPTVLQTVKILKLVKTGCFGCEAEFAEV